MYKNNHKWYKNTQKCKIRNTQLIYFNVILLGIIYVDLLKFKLKIGSGVPLVNKPVNYLDINFPGYNVLREYNRHNMECPSKIYTNNQKN